MIMISQRTFTAASRKLFLSSATKSTSTLSSLPVSTISSPLSPFTCTINPQLRQWKQFSTNIKSDNDTASSTTIIEINQDEQNTTSTTALSSSPSTPWLPQQFIRDRPESILTTTYSESADYTLGQGWSTIQKHLAGGQKIRHADFVTLCQKVQSQSIKDANLLITISKELKRCNHFILSKSNAKEMVNGMYKALTPTSGDIDDSTAYYKVRCGLKIGEAFVNTKTGLYVSLEAQDVQDKILIPLYNGLLELQENLEGRKKSDSEGWEEKNEMYRTKSRELFQSSLTLSNDLMNVLLTRALTPTIDMKKRAKRKYLKYLRCCDGPTPLMVDYLVRICLIQTRFEKHFGGVNSTDDGEVKVNDGIRIAKSILDAFGEKQFLGKAMSETYTMVEEAEVMFNAPLVEEEDHVETDAEDGEQVMDDADTVDGGELSKEEGESKDKN